MSLNTQPVRVELSTGATIPLRPLKAKSGNIYHAVLKRRADGKTFYNPGKYGVKVTKDVVGGKLPEHATVAGTKVTAVPGMTKTGNRKVSFTSNVKIDGQDRVLRLSISALPNGDFNVSGVLNRPGGAGGQGAAETL